MREFTESAVEDIFLNYPEKLRDSLLQMREIIFQVAAQQDIQIMETLRWWQPSYLPIQSKVGTTIRIDQFSECEVAIFFNCKTTIVEELKETFGASLRYSKNRAIIFNINAPLPMQTIEYCVAFGLSYFKRKVN